MPPAAYSLRGSSGMNRSRRFDNTMVIPNSRILSPPIFIPNSNQYPRSVPRVNHNTNEENSYFFGLDRISSHHKNNLSREMDYQLQQQHYQDESQNNDLYQPPPQSLQSNHPRELFQNQPPIYTKPSRNAKRSPQPLQRYSSGGVQLKSTLSDGDFMQMKWSINQMDSLDGGNGMVSLQKQCTTEISNLVEERIEDSRRRRGEPIDNSQHGAQYPSLNVEHINSRRGTSSFQSATFRKLSQNNSPQKNLQYHFDQVKIATPGFVQPSSQKQSYILDQEDPQYYTDYNLQSQLQNYEQFEEVKNYQLLPKNLQSIGVSSKNSDQANKKYLKNLMIRENKVKAQQRQTAQETYEDIKVERKQEQPKHLAPIVQSVSVVSDEYGTFTNQQSSTDQNIKPPKPPSSHDCSQASVQQVSKLPSERKEGSSSEGGTQCLVNHQYLTRQNSERRVSEAVSQQFAVGSQSAKNQKLEDIKRIYGRKA
ncbi:hypothetical protein FGO68_gene15060 [Halteria grandinella]|uniref:Uncharacterized protein n=1 Tax=Halteria grandinella TaxID=5974 RepID=A0A8J8NA49_HALGN|nr:hypothetical protein FGO68_gene15060 [Halteria grandinella]